MENESGFKSKHQIARDLQISYSTLYRRLKQAGIAVPDNRLLSPAECQVIYDHFRIGVKKNR